jgi:hypothetical protein
MPWSKKLPAPIVLRDGQMALTLDEVRELLRAISPRYRQGAVWRYVGELIKEAANDRASVEEVAEVLSRGLRGAGLL